MNSLPHIIPPQYTNVDPDRVEYSYISRGPSHLDALLKAPLELSKNLSLTNKDIKCILGESYEDALKEDRVINELESKFKDLDITHLLEFNEEFLRKLYSYQFFKVLKNAEQTGSLPSGFPYLGNGYLHYESLVSSSCYQISKVATQRFQSFFNGALISGAVGVNDHYVFLGPGTGNEVLVMFDAISQLEPNYKSKLGSLVLIDFSKSVLDATFNNIYDQLSLQDDSFQLKALVGDFNSIKIKPIHTSYVGSIINLLIGFTSGNMNCHTLMSFIDNLTLDGSQIVIDTCLYSKREELDTVIDSYNGSLNARFLMHNFISCLTDSGIDERLIESMIRKFSVDLVDDPFVSDFVSVQSSTLLSQDLIDEVNEKFDVVLPEHLVLMDSYRRKAGAFIGYLEENNFDLVSTRKFKGHPGDSMTLLIKKSLV